MNCHLCERAFSQEDQQKLFRGTSSIANVSLQFVVRNGLCRKMGTAL